MVTTLHFSELSASTGQTFGPGEWVVIDQPMIDQFAEVTGDHQWIHVDPERAATGPFGATIAHGFLTLSLLPLLSASVFRVSGTSSAVNYGLNKVRFPSPVRVGSRVAATVEIAEVSEVGGGGLQVVRKTTVVIDGGDKPGCVAEMIARYYPENPT